MPGGAGQTGTAEPGAYDLGCYNSAGVNPDGGLKKSLVIGKTHGYNCRLLIPICSSDPSYKTEDQTKFNSSVGRNELRNTAASYV
jgi:hypothetical protein